MQSTLRAAPRAVGGGHLLGAAEAEKHECQDGDVGDGGSDLR
jgi:hypothetical protein